MLRFCTLFFRPRTRPRTSLQCFALDSCCSKAKHCRDVLGQLKAFCDLLASVGLVNKNGCKGQH